MLTGVIDGQSVFRIAPCRPEFLTVQRRPGRELMIEAGWSRRICSTSNRFGTNIRNAPSFRQRKKKDREQWVAISSSTGLISGMDIESIVTSLMKIEHRSVDLLSSKKSKLESEQAAMMTLSAKLLSLKLTATNLKTSTTFRPRSVTSSDESILTASVTSSANLGTYSFRVRQIAQSHQMISQGFADPEHSAIGEGSLTFRDRKRQARSRD